MGDATYLRSLFLLGYKPDEVNTELNLLKMEKRRCYVLTARMNSRLWKQFLAAGSQHSGRASLLPYIIRRCEQEKIAYTLEAMPGVGYYIKRRVEK